MNHRDFSERLEVLEHKLGVDPEKVVTEPAEIRLLRICEAQQKQIDHLFAKLGSAYVPEKQNA